MCICLMHDVIHWLMTCIEEVMHIHLVHRHHVIVAVDEMLSKTRDLMQEHLNCSAVECRKQFFGNYVFMQDYMHFALVKPIRNLLFV